MPKLATVKSLENYPKLPINSVTHQLSKAGAFIVNGEQITVTATSCNYGGSRYWWQCPKCGRRVGVLYFNQSYQCRHCIGANYSIQLQQPIDRLFKRVAVIRERLGWPQGIANGKGERPRYMHHKTYQKLIAEHDELSQQIIERLI